MDALFVLITIVFFVVAARTSSRASGWSEHMTLDYLVGLVVTAGLLAYLTYALLRPEKF